jgi:hypothetical protein
LKKNLITCLVYAVFNFWRWNSGTVDITKKEGGIMKKDKVAFEGERERI